MYRFLLFISALLAGNAVMAQSDGFVCGTVGEYAQMVSERLLQNKEAYQQGSIEFRDDITYVALKFHLVGKNDGSGRVPEPDVFDQLCALNEDFAPMDIQFYIKNGFKYVNNTTIYSNHGSVQSTLMYNTRDLGAINVWILESAATSGAENAAGYYTPIYDWLVVGKGEINGFAKVLTHEIGHYFSLPHPFNGWDFDPYDPGVHGDPAPTNSPGDVPTELQDGSNCNTSGDFMCDTAPDYFFTESDCNYTGGAKDPNGEEIEPDERLFMSNFFGCPRDEWYFSTEQQAIVIQDLMSPQRNHIRPNVTPNTSVIEEDVVLIEPIDGVTIQGYNAVNLQWQGVAGADQYLLEIDNLPTFNSSSKQRLIISGTNKMLSLEPNKNYFWRVTPFNSYYTCQSASNTKNFKTDGTTATNELDAVNSWTISPNPANSKDELSIQVEANQSFDAIINLFDITGKQIGETMNNRFEAGSNAFRLPIYNVAPGLYLISIHTDSGTINKRVVVK